MRSLSVLIVAGMYWYYIQLSRTHQKTLRRYALYAYLPGMNTEASHARWVITLGTGQITEGEGGQIYLVEQPNELITNINVHLHIQPPGAMGLSNSSASDSRTTSSSVNRLRRADASRPMASYSRCKVSSVQLPPPSIRLMARRLTPETSESCAWVKPCSLRSSINACIRGLLYSSVM